MWKRCPGGGYRIAVRVERLDSSNGSAALAAAPKTRQNRWGLPALLGVAALSLAGWTVERSRMPPAVQAQASELARQGWVILDERNSPTFPAAMALFDEALRMNPRLATAHAGKAALYALESNERAAETEAARVEELDPSVANPEAVRGFLRMMYHWDWTGAEPLFARTRSMACYEPLCRQWNSLYLALTGQTEESVRVAAEAVELIPGRLAPRARYAQILYWSGQTDAAIRECRMVLAAGGVWTHARYHLWKALLAKGDRRGAAETILLALEPEGYRLPEGDDMTQLREHSDAWGTTEFWKMLLAARESLGTSAYFLAEIAMAGGDPEVAVQQLEKCRQARNFFLPFAKRDPLFAPLHGNPRYEAVMKAVGL